jgi:hypothetical protein
LIGGKWGLEKMGGVRNVVTFFLPLVLSFSIRRIDMAANIGRPSANVGGHWRRSASVDVCILNTIPLMVKEITKLTVVIWSDCSGRPPQ